MKAARLHSFDEDHLHIDEIDEPTITGPHDVIVRVGAAGLCRTDLHIIEGIWRETVEPELPYTLGHENAGWVEEIGDAVTSVAVGDTVICHPVRTCGVCLGCRRGEDMYCDNDAFPGLTTDGGFANYLHTNERACIKLAEGLEPVAVAPLADAGITAYRAAKKASKRLAPGMSCAVIGVGGLGHIAVQSLRALCGADIIAVDKSDQALELARELDVDHVVKADENVVARVKEVGGGEGVDVVIDFVAEYGTEKQGPNMLKQGGVYYVVGYGGQVEIPTLQIIFTEIEVVGSLVGSYIELVELMELAARGRVKLTGREYPLDDINQAIDDLMAVGIQGRGVIVPA